MKTIIILVWCITQVVGNEVMSGTTIGKYMKPGLAVELAYISEKVAVGEMSDVNITVSTSSIKNGILHISISPDKKLQGFRKKRFSFTIDKEHNSFPINLKLSSNSNGIHYINIFAKIKGMGMRAFAVPVYVGNGKNNFQSKVVRKTKQGTNITISPAQESIIDGDN